MDHRVIEHRPLRTFITESPDAFPVRRWKVSISYEVTTPDDVVSVWNYEAATFEEAMTGATREFTSHINRKEADFRKSLGKDGLTES